MSRLIPSPDVVNCEKSCRGNLGRLCPGETECLSLVINLHTSQAGTHLYSPGGLYFSLMIDLNKVGHREENKRNRKEELEESEFQVSIFCFTALATVT